MRNTYTITTSESGTTAIAVSGPHYTTRRLYILSGSGNNVSAHAIRAPRDLGPFHSTAACISALIEFEEAESRALVAA